MLPAAPSVSSHILLPSRIPAVSRAQTVGESRTRIHDPEAEALQKLLADAQSALDQKDYSQPPRRNIRIIWRRSRTTPSSISSSATRTPRCSARPTRNRIREGHRNSIPKMEPAYLNLGMTLVEIGDANARYRSSPKGCGPRAERGAAKFLLGRRSKGRKAAGSDRAISSRRKARRQEPRHSRRRSAALLLASNRAADAEPEFRAAIALRPDSPQAHLGLAQSSRSRRRSRTMRPRNSTPTLNPSQTIPKRAIERASTPHRRRQIRRCARGTRSRGCRKTGESALAETARQRPTSN